ncbi:MAG: hypothetical protein AAB676_20625 [Verrucomicrobiota bacterium]
MPIRVNLLAEQQAAEEMRRRDPVKRAIWAGSILVALVFLWSLSLQFKVRNAGAQMVALQKHLQDKEEEAKQAKSENMLNLRIAADMAVLQKYASNRFLWGTTLDALQHTIVTNVRLVKLDSLQKYFTNNEAKLEKTNLVFEIPPPKGWQFWKSAPPKTNIQLAITNRFIALTNQYRFTTNKVRLSNKIAKMTTNQTKTQISAELEIYMPAIGVEQTLLTITAGDYSPAGKQVDEFMKSIANSPYFNAALKKAEGQGIRLKERPTQPQPDMEDPLNPSAAFFPFTIECRYEDKILAND